MHQVLILDTGKQTDCGRLDSRRSAVNRRNAGRVEACDLSAVAGGVTFERSGRRVESADEMADIVVIANLAGDVRTPLTEHHGHCYGLRMGPIRRSLRWRLLRRPHERPVQHRHRLGRFCARQHRHEARYRCVARFKHLRQVLDGAAACDQALALHQDLVLDAGEQSDCRRLNRSRRSVNRVRLRRVKTLNRRRAVIA